MTMKRAEKKRIGWAAKGEAQYLENPVARGAARRAGRPDYITGAEFIAGTRKRVAEGESRGRKLVEQRITNRRRGYRG
jgi:hypothetical protein